MNSSPVGIGDGDDFEGPADVGDGFLTSANSGRPCFGPNAIKSPAKPMGFTLEPFGGKFFPLSIAYCPSNSIENY